MTFGLAGVLGYVILDGVVLRTRCAFVNPGLLVILALAISTSR